MIDAKEPEPFSYDRDYVVLLSDWTDEDPERVLAKLKSNRITTTSTNVLSATSSMT